MPYNYKIEAFCGRDFFPRNHFDDDKLL